jgi:hypothetical protein
MKTLISPGLAATILSLAVAAWLLADRVPQDPTPVDVHVDVTLSTPKPEPTCTLLPGKWASWDCTPLIRQSSN